MTESRILATASLVESAHIAAGAVNMVDDALWARVDALAGYFRENGPYSVDQEIATRRQIVKLLARRIGIAADIARHPQILDEQVTEPIFIVGFPRTGTSILQALLAADPANRGVRGWQTREPSPPPGERPVAPWRLHLAEDQIFKFVQACPGILTLHPYWDEGANVLIEDEEILSLDFRTNYPTLLYDAPSLGYMATKDDHDGAYRFIKLFMQHQQWRLPARRWVMKGIDHQSALTALFRMFPDARCVFPHREPASFVPSSLAIGSVCYDGVTSGALDRQTLGRVMFEDYRARLRQMQADPALDDPRVTNLLFDDFITDPVGTLRAAYREWGFAWSAPGEAAMTAWLDDPANDGSRYGRHHYTFEAYGVDWKQESASFDGYRAKFLSDHAAGRQAVPATAQGHGND